MKNPCLAAALQELHAAGINRITQANGGKHLQLRWPSNNTSTGERAYTLPISPSDWRSADNTRADIRRILRADGVLPTTERRPPPPKPSSRLELIERRVAVLERRLTALEQHKTSCVECSQNPPRDGLAHHHDLGDSHGN